MSLQAPIWLLLILPVALAWWFWTGPAPVVRVLRAVLLVLVILTMAGPVLRLPDRAGTVVVVADRSRSMPDDAELRQREMIDLVQQAMGPRDRLAVVAFGERAVVEHGPDVGRFGGFIQTVGVDGSDLAGAVERAMGLVPADGGGRLLVLSDGRWTGRDPMPAAGRAAAQRVAIDHRVLARSRANDLAVQQFETPLQLSEGESFMLHGWVRSPVAQRVRYELRRGEQELAAGERDVPAGLSRLTFRDRGERAGVRQYALHVQGQDGDPVSENNTARALVEVTGQRPVLVVTDAPTAALARLLEAGGLAVAVRQPEQMDWSLAALSGNAAVILENVPANRIPDGGLPRLAGWVQTIGGGLMLTGGQRSFGPGGYFESPLDPLLPVSMELRQEHRKLGLAVVVALDRSGSMSMPVAGGRTKMDLANLGTAKVLDMLTPMDEFGVLTIDSSPHTIVPMQRLPADPAPLRDRVMRIDSMGGGIFVEDALVAAGRMLANAEAQTKHIILFSDAQDSEKPGRYRRILEAFEQAGITVSVIGLGTEHDVDAALLKDIASRGSGRIFFTQEATRLPELFAQDMFVVARSSFVEALTPVSSTAGLAALLGRSIGNPPGIGGYNLTYLRSGATLAMITRDEYEAPVVAAWQAGLGRAAVYTGEADGAFTGPIAQWPAVGELLTSLARWTAGEQNTLPETMMLAQRLERGAHVVELHIDSRRSATQLSSVPVVTTVRDGSAGALRVDEVAMRWIDADLLRAEVPMTDEGTALSTVRIPGHGEHRLAPVRLPYSPEYAPQDEAGDRALASLARATGGHRRLTVADIWGDLPRLPRWLPLGHWLMLVAILVLLLEVLERRTGLVGRLRLSAGRNPFRRRHAVPSATVPSDAAARSKKARRQPSAATASASAAPASVAPEPDDSPTSAAAKPGSLADAFTQAQRRASHRRGRRSS